MERKRALQRERRWALAMEIAKVANWDDWIPHLRHPPTETVLPKAVESR